MDATEDHAVVSGAELLRVPSVSSMPTRCFTSDMRLRTLPLNGSHNGSIDGGNISNADGGNSSDDGGHI